MKISVDSEACQGHGRCAFVAPGVFSLDSDLELTYNPSPDASERADVEEAIAGCPEQAIREIPEAAGSGGEQATGS
jgi:ferredoxin